METFELECAPCKFRINVSLGLEPEVESWSAEISWKCPKCGSNRVRILTPQA